MAISRSKSTMLRAGSDRSLFCNTVISATENFRDAPSTLLRQERVRAGARGVLARGEVLRAIAEHHETRLPLDALASRVARARAASPPAAAAPLAELDDLLATLRREPSEAHEPALRRAHALLPALRDSYLFLYGTLLILVMLFEPKGLLGLWDRLPRALRRRAKVANAH